MLRIVLIAGALVVGLSAQAYAAGCPGVSKQVTAGLAKSSLPAAKKSEIMALRDKGDGQHKAGKHGESIATLKSALAMLGK